MPVTINGTTGIAGVDGSAGTPAVQGSDTNTGVYFPAADTISASTGGTERMRIDSSGNVGIGTTSAGFRLTVRPHIQITSPTFATLELLNDTGIQARFIADSANSPNTASIGTLSNHDFKIATNNTERMRIDTSGNVGIGATPTAKLDVYGPSGVTSFTGTAKLGLTLRGATNATEYLGINFASLGGDVVARIGGRVTNSGSTIEFGTSNSYVSGVTNTAMMIDWNGNVGIGTTSPEASRALTLNSASNYFGIAFQVANTTHARLIQEATGALYIDSNVQGGANGGTVFRTGGTERMRIDSSGNLLIASTNSSPNIGTGIKLVQNSGVAPLISIVGSASTNSDSSYHVYSTGAAAYRFYVGYGGTIYATSATITALSDVRLKENIKDLDVGLAAINKLRPRKFDWKAGKGADIKNARGFIAQEFEQIFPDLIDTWKDPAPEGEEPYKSVRPDLIPVLVRAIQELSAKNDELASRIATLEAA